MSSAYAFPHQQLQQSQGPGPGREIDSPRDPLLHLRAGANQPYQYDHQLPQDHPPRQQYGAIDASTNGHGGEPQQLTPGGAGDAKGNRLRKACDSCSIRKVKCDESGPPCRACAALEIPCTFERPSRRRGPPNRHAEAIKRRRVDSPIPSAGFSSPTSPDNVAATLASFSSHAVLSAESICPFSILELLVDDFFTYIHPLVPFPHEPSFRAAFRSREDLNNPSFLALLASMVGALVASFPRKPRQHLKAQRRENLFPNSVSLVERCHKVAVEARGPGYLDKELSVYDAATSYFLGLAGGYIFNWRQCRLYFGETITMARAIGLHRPRDSTYYNTGPVPPHESDIGYEKQPGETIDYIRQEIGRRIFWVMFVGVRSMQQLGVPLAELFIPPPTPAEPYPPYPLEVDDQYIYVSHIDPQPPGVISEVTGFNYNIQVYMTCTPLTTMEMAYGIDEVFDWSRQKRVLEECLKAVKRKLEDIPPELKLAPGSQVGEFDQSYSYNNRQFYQPPPNFPGPQSGGGNEQSTAGQFNGYRNADSQRYIQYEIQKANIYVSQLGTRSYIIEKYWNLFDAYNRLKANNNDTSPIDQSSPGVMVSGLDGMMTSRGMGAISDPQYDAVETQMSNERESVVKDLLRVLSSISQVNMEPNGGSFINKVRQIASTLLDTPRNRKGPLALKADEYLGRFLDVLMKLERINPARSTDLEGYAATAAEDEEEELRNWADLREFQTRFVQSGGFNFDA